MSLVLLKVAITRCNAYVPVKQSQARNTDTDTMTFDETRTTQRWQPSARWLFLVPVLPAAGTLSAILTVANQLQGFADIRAGSSVPHFISEALVFDPPEFDA